MSDLFTAGLVDDAKALFARLADVPEDTRIDLINQIRLALHEHSPMRGEPVDCVVWVPADQVRANAYNPNVVAPAEKQLLTRSILADGYTQPIVAWPVTDDTGSAYEIVDGFHRNMVGRQVRTIAKRIRGHLPLAVIRPDRTDKGDRMAATIRHNRARGQHTVDGMSDVVLELARRGWSNEKIGAELGMEPDEVLRLRQVGGLAELFADREFSAAWEARDPGDVHPDDVEPDDLNRDPFTSAAVGTPPAVPETATETT